MPGVRQPGPRASSGVRVAYTAAQQSLSLRVADKSQLATEYAHVLQLDATIE